jgi:hypothetical protein
MVLLGIHRRLKNKMASMLDVIRSVDVMMLLKISTTVWTGKNYTETMPN